MPSLISRRRFIGNVGAIAAASLASRSSVSATGVTSGRFKLSVITDEITQDFGRALEVAAKEFGLGYVELRELWGKNLMKLDAKEVGEARRLLEQHRLRVSSIASPIFKVDWPGAPASKFSPKRDQFGADFTFKQQDELLERGIDLARTLKTDRIAFLISGGSKIKSLIARR